jgi:hypothetical protein
MERDEDYRARLLRRCVSGGLKYNIVFSTPAGSLDGVAAHFNLPKRKQVTNEYGEIAP